MSDISIDKKTGISIGLLLVIAPVAFWGITNWTRMQGQTDRNTTDITSILVKFDTLNDNLNKTNGNIIELSTKLDALSARANIPAGTTSKATPTSPVSATYLQPSTNVQPTESQERPQEIVQPQQPTSPSTSPIQQPESPTQPEKTVLANIVETVENVLRTLE